MALPVVPIAYGVIRGLLARYGSKQGVKTLMRELGVNQRTASNIMQTYRKVGKKGDITQKLGGKDVVSNRNVINVQLGDSAQATLLKNNPLLKRGGAGQKANLLGRNTLNPTAGSKMYPQGTGQGLLSTVNQGIRTGANATGRGLLATGRFAGSPTGIGLGLLGTGAYAAIPDENAGLNQPGRDAYYDGQGNLVIRDGANTGNSYQDKVNSGEIVPKITKQSYEEFKKQKDIFNNTGSVTDKMFSRFTGSEADPSNKPQFAEEAELYRLEMGLGGPRQDSIYSDEYNKKIAEMQKTQKGKFNIAYNALPDTDAISATTAKAELGKLDDAISNITTGAAMLEGSQPPQNIYGDRIERGRYDENGDFQPDEIGKGEDRGIIARTFGFGDEPIYREKMYDPETQKYISDDNGRILTEADLVRGSREVTNFQSTSSNSLNIADDPRSNPNNIAFNATGEGIGPVVAPTETVGTGTSRTIYTNPDGTQAVGGMKSNTVNAPATGDLAQIMGLANFLSNQNKNQYMGNTGNFNMGIFNNQTPMQQYYGQRPLGFLDPEFYRRIGGMFQ